MGLCQVKGKFFNLVIMKGIIIYEDIAKDDLDTKVVMKTRDNEENNNEGVKLDLNF